MACWWSDRRRTSTALSTEDRKLLEAFANQLAVAVERQNIAEQQAATLALQESDRLKTALISSVSHELKTPLAAIKASATALLAEAESRRSGVQTELAESINRETDRLTRLVSNLLDMSRLEAGALRPKLEWVSIADVISDVLDRMEPLMPDRQISVELAEPVPPTPLDFVQISQVLTNLLDNSARHSPAAAAISISAEVVREQLRVTVFNEGSHIPPLEAGAAVRQVLSAQCGHRRRWTRAVHCQGHCRGARGPHLGGKRRTARCRFHVYHSVARPANRARLELV